VNSFESHLDGSPILCHAFRARFIWIVPRSPISFHAVFREKSRRADSAKTRCIAESTGQGRV
jgi:hypothetical protein